MPSGTDPEKNRDDAEGIFAPEQTEDAEEQGKNQTPYRLKDPSDKVAYLDGDALGRPLNPPRAIMLGGAGLVITAGVIGAVVLGVYFDGMVNGPAREQALVDEYVAKEVTLGLPTLPTLVTLDDAAIMAHLQESGATLFERSQAEPGKPLQVIKLPEDVSLADAASLYLKGISSLSASEAAKLLNGSWELTVNRENGLNMGIHYADFTSGTPERAVSNAALSQGFDTEGDVESGVDSSGNTYIAGAISIADQSYSWKVSAVPLSDVYSQKGLPENAVYVGIRLYR
ncbi:teichoic acid transporter [Adlercreutzia murintestinalis]|uniref:teichoic acid transporter n=1 Tax=Adlercreutzia murintestinalis TaxID=2941325 RepID=UPI00203F4129|nr:teichoic acid transporter [Adlercreutzia murintestinalis]